MLFFCEISMWCLWCLALLGFLVLVRLSIRISGSMPDVITPFLWLKQRAAVRFDAYQGNNDGMRARNLRAEESEVSGAENTRGTVSWSTTVQVVTRDIRNVTSLSVTNSISCLQLRANLRQWPRLPSSWARCRQDSPLERTTSSEMILSLRRWIQQGSRCERQKLSLRD